MPEQKSELQQMMPYLVVSGVVLIIILAVVFWPNPKSESSELASKPDREATSITTNNALAEITEAQKKPYEASQSAAEVFEAPKLPSALSVGEGENTSEVLAPILEDSENTNIALSINDQAVKSAIVIALKSEAIRNLLVDDALLERFVINVYDLVNQEITLKDSLLIAPNSKFQVYQQAGRWWIDESSYERYSPYVNALESMDAKALVDVFESYKPKLLSMYGEISRPNESLDVSLVDAIDELLATPEPKLPLEVIVETVMYRFAEPDIEGLSSPQKQMIRMGPENMNQFKGILKSIKLELESRR